jgi:hypothetical protein
MGFLARTQFWSGWRCSDTSSGVLVGPIQAPPSRSPPCRSLLWQEKAVSPWQHHPFVRRTVHWRWSRKWLGRVGLFRHALTTSYFYVDYTFVIWQHGSDKMRDFLHHPNSIHQSIQFTMETESEGHLPFLDLDIYRRPDGSLGHKVYCKPTHCIFTSTPSPILTHPISKRRYVLWYTEPEISVMKTACRLSWCSWRTSSERMTTTTDRSTEPSTAVRTHLNWTTSPTHSPSSFCRNCIQSFKQSVGPTQHQIYGLAPKEIIQSPPSSKGPPQTKDTRGVQDPLWVWQSLHWADGQFHGHQVKGASTAHKTRTPNKSAVAEHSIDQGQHSIPQFFHPRHENQIYGPHC